MPTNQFNPQDKMLQYIDKVNTFLSIGKTLVVAELDLTNRCNNRCPACVGRNTVKDELTWDEILRIADGLQELDCKGVILSGGGEPLLHPLFIQTIALLRGKGLQIGVNTNCLALNQEQAEAIAKYCKYCRISLDSGDAKLYRKTHGMDTRAFDNVLENIRLLAAVKKREGTLLSLGTGFLTSKETAGQMECFVKLSKECGVDFAQFRPFQEDTTDVLEEYARLKKIYDDDGFRVLASQQKYGAFKGGKAKLYDHCRGMFFSTVITANARVYACLHHRQDPRYLIGDMREGNSLAAIWNSYQKWKVFEQINVQGCPAFCRNDAINRTLDGLSKKVFHQEFL